MDQQERAIVRAERTVWEQLLDQKFLLEADQELINQQVREGLVYCHDFAYGFRRVHFFMDYSIMIPEHFEEMRTEFIKRKYPSEHRPDIVYTNESSMVNLTFSDTDEEVSSHEVERYFSNTFHSMRKLYGSGAVLSNEMIETGGVKVGYFDLVTQGFDKKIYNLIFHFLGDGRIIRGTLNCPQDKASLWKLLMIGMLSSLETGGSET